MHNNKADITNWIDGLRWSVRRCFIYNILRFLQRYFKGIAVKRRIHTEIIKFFNDTNTKIIVLP